jgi:hypothetical protein
MKKVRLTFVAMLATLALAFGACDKPLDECKDGKDCKITPYQVIGEVSKCIDNSAGGDVPVPVVDAASDAASDANSDDADSDEGNDGDSDDIQIAPNDGNSDDDGSSDVTIAPAPSPDGFSWSYDAASKTLTVKHDGSCFECGWEVGIVMLKQGENDVIEVLERINATLGTDCICGRDLSVSMAGIDGPSISFAYSQSVVIDSKVDLVKVFDGALDLSKKSGKEIFSAKLPNVYTPERCVK